MTLVEALSRIDVVYHLAQHHVSREPPTSIRRQTSAITSSARSIFSNSMQRLGLTRLLFLSSMVPFMGFRTLFPSPICTLCDRSVPMGSSKRRSNTIWKCFGRHEGSRLSLFGLQIHLARGSPIPASRCDLDIPPPDIGGRTRSKSGETAKSYGITLKSAIWPALAFAPE